MLFPFSTHKEAELPVILSWFILPIPSHYRLVEDAGILTDCSIKTQEPDDLLEFDFSGEDVENKIIMKVFI